MAYTLKVQAISESDVGTRYHVGLGIPDPAGSGNPIIYGYCFPNDDQRGFFNEAIDVSSRDQLLTASPELIDRDLVSFPRITQGRFDGGQGQATAIDLTKYWDSDLDVSVAGYLRLRPAWKRITTAGVPRQIVPLVGASNDYFWFVVTGSGVGSGLYYLLNTAITKATSSLTNFGPITTDGAYVYAAAGAAGNGAAGPIYRYDNAGGESQVISATVGPVGQFGPIWVVQQGTNGWWLFYLNYTPLIPTLYKVDLTQSYPIGAAGSALVPFGGNSVYVLNIQPFSTGVAILTTPASNSLSGNGFDLWYHDGASTTRIAHIDGYTAAGMCECLGDLYISANTIQGTAQPVLFKVDSSSVELVAVAGLPSDFSAGAALAPTASGRWVFWPVSTPIDTGAATPQQQTYIAIYDVITQTLSRLAYVDATDAPQALAAMGDCVVAGTTGSALQGLANNQAVALPFSLQTTGWLVTSRFDFNTPSISKLLRRVTITHAPLNTGESIYVEAHVDQDPTVWTRALGPTPVGASKTNSTVGSTTTVLTLPQATLGKAMYLAIRLIGPGTSTPIVFFVAVEVSTPWAWKFTVECTAQRKNLTGQDDTPEQGLRARDLYWLLHTAWEEALPVTFYHPNGSAYTAAIEDLSFDMRSPMFTRPDPNRDDQDFDSYATLTLRQELG